MRISDSKAEDCVDHCMSSWRIHCMRTGARSSRDSSKFISGGAGRQIIMWDVGTGGGERYGLCA